MTFDLLTRAEQFATEKHQGQTRKGVAQEPYITHVQEVAALVTSFGVDPETIMAAWLHDVVEDCPPTSLQDIELVFGERVASIVAELTDDKSLPKATRKELQIANAVKKSPQACIINLADKISNVRSLFLSPPSNWSQERLLTYVLWTRSVVTNLPHKPDSAMRMFNEVFEEACKKFS